MPLLLLIINALPIQYFGWIEFVGGVAKLTLVVGTIVLMFMINAGFGPNSPIGDTYFEDGVTNNPNVASSHAIAVFESIPLATFAYIGVELISMTAFEALDPRELKLPARNIGWFMTVLYAIATGSFVANVSWQDQNLPRLFNQALVMVRNPDLEIILPNGPSTSTGAAPLIALYRAGFRFLPSFLNGCFIYSAFSCANTALYVASRQLHGLTRSISVDANSNVLRKFLAWTSGVDHRTRSPWPALVISALALCWLPFIRLHHSNDLFLEDVQAALMNIGSVSCILVWASQCAAYISFVHYRSK